MKISCIIVDDEPLARKVLVKYIAELDTLDLVKECRSATEALALLQQQPIDLMFLDMKMPDMSGLELLNTLERPPKVIITTAYSEFALEGYEYSVVDYLLKPFHFARFMKAVNRAIDSVKRVFPTDAQTPRRPEQEYIYLKSDRILHKILFGDILYIEGYGNYLKVYTNGGVLLVAETIIKISERLPEEDFIRVHKSYVIALDKINQIEDGWIKINDKEIPIGSTYKHKFYQRLDGYK